MADHPTETASSESGGPSGNGGTDRPRATKKRLRWLFGVAALLVLGLAVGGGFLWWSLGKPMYSPGEARAEQDLEPPTQPAHDGNEGRWAMPDDVELAWFARGQGEPVLVIHGGPGIPDVGPWPGLEPLTDRIRAYHFAQRGSGASTRPFDRFDTGNVWEVMQTVEAKLGLGAQIADIERIRRILGVDRLTLIGHSFGGLIAAMYAAEFPEHIKALVLVTPADLLVFPSPNGDLFELVRERLPEDERERYDAFLARYLDFGSLGAMSEQELVERQRELGHFYLLAMGADTEEMQGEMPDAGGWVVPACFLSLGRRHDWREELSAVSAPALVIHGTDDLQPEAASLAYVDALPNAELVRIEGAQHFPHQTQPAEFAQAVGSFLSRVQ